nr:hypothetical protein [uncultured Roseovarius sp.]
MMAQAAINTGLIKGDGLSIARSTYLTLRSLERAEQPSNQQM